MYMYELDVRPDALRIALGEIRDLYVQAGLAVRQETGAIFDQLVRSTRTAWPIPAVPVMRTEAQEAAKIVRAAESAPDHDAVNHPRHYTFYKGLEIIDLTEQMNFNRGNAVKYIARAGIKDQAHEIQDLEKAKWYIQREIDRLKKGKDDEVSEMRKQEGEG